MRIKPGVDLANVAPQIAIALCVVDRVFDAYGLTMWVTSIYRPGEAAMLHAKGLAVDLRAPRRCELHGKVPLVPISHLDDEVTTTVREALGGFKPDGQFDVLFERFGNNPDNDHIHIEWDPTK
jgi:hypothetical protein